MKRLLPWILLGVCGIGLAVLGYLTVSLQIRLSQEKSKLEICNTELAEQDSLFATAQAEITRLEKIAFCSQNAFTPDYSSNPAMSSALKLHVGNTVGKDIYDATWNLLWNNASAAIHVIFVSAKDSNLKESYIVYFQESGLKKGVYDLNSQCWLDYQSP
jgi:hypothetical protein